MQIATAITPAEYLVFSILLLCIGITGIIINRKNLIVALMSLELIFLASSTNFIIFSYFYQLLVGQIFVFFILTVSAVEACIGLAILIVLFRSKSDINADKLITLME